MIKECPHCNKYLNDLKPTQKGQHTSNCKLNPNYQRNKDKRVKTRLINQRIKNPVLKLKLNCLYCGKEYEIDVIESYYRRGSYKKCCCKICSKKYSSSFFDKTLKKIKNCKNCGKEIEVNVVCSDNVYCDDCRKVSNRNGSSELNKEIRKRKNRIFKNGKWRKLFVKDLMFVKNYKIKIMFL